MPIDARRTLSVKKPNRSILSYVIMIGVLILIAVLLITVTGFLVTNYQNNELARLTAETSIRQREANGGRTDSVMEQVIVPCCVSDRVME